MKMNFVQHFYYTPLEDKGSMHYGAHPLIFKKAGELRNNITPAEKVL